MKVVVTGGAGFIGCNLARALTVDSSVDTVVVLDDLSTGSLANLAGVEVEFVEGTILDRTALERCVDGADAVVHLAARPSVPRSIADPIATHRANVDGTLSVLEACRRAGNPHVIVASSSSVYGGNPGLPKHEELAPRPLSPYAASKLAAEAYAFAYQESYGLPALVFRFFNVFGPWQPAHHDYAAVVPAFLSAALQGEPLYIFGDGLQTRDFTFVGTVVDVLRRSVIDRVVDPGPVNLAFGTRTDLLTLVGLIDDVVGHPSEVRHEPPRVGDPRDSQADSARLRALFSDLQPVSLEEGLRQTAEWFRSQASATA
jgi:UDP-glucose 4-epimerase